LVGEEAGERRDRKENTGRKRGQNLEYKREKSKEARDVFSSRR